MLSRETFSHPAWFALRVHPNHERTTERALQLQGLDAYLPVQRVRRRWSDRIKELDAALFPGYVFCRFGYPDRMRVLQSPGVRTIVSCGKDPLPVDQAEIDAVRSLISSGRPIARWPYLRVGQSVAITAGPLASLRGVLVRAKDAWRVVVSVDALNTSIAVEVDSDFVVSETLYGRCQA